MYLFKLLYYQVIFYTFLYVNGLIYYSIFYCIIFNLLFYIFTRSFLFPFFSLFFINSESIFVFENEVSERNV